VISIAKSITIGNGEKELYRIFKDLEKYGRSTFTYPDKAKRNSISQQISYKTKDIPVPELFLPPANYGDSRRIKQPTSAILLPPNVYIEEKKLRNGSIFKFFKIK